MPTLLARRIIVQSYIFLGIIQYMDLALLVKKDKKREELMFFLFQYPLRERHIPAQKSVKRIIRGHGLL